MNKHTIIPSAETVVETAIEAVEIQAGAPAPAKELFQEIRDSYLDSETFEEHKDELIKILINAGYNPENLAA